MGQHNRVCLAHQFPAEGFEFIQRDFPGSCQFVCHRIGAINQCGLDEFRGLLHRAVLGLVFQAIHQLLASDVESLGGELRVGKLQQDPVHQLVQFVVISAHADGDAPQVRVHAVIQPCQAGGVGPGVEVGVDGIHQKLA